MTSGAISDDIRAQLADGPGSLTDAERAQLTPTQKKRSFFSSFTKKKQPGQDMSTDQIPTSSPTSVPPITTTAVSPTAASSATASPVSPVRSSHFGSQRGLPKTSSSPRLSTSSIFERNVQDPSLPPSSPGIPAHFSTENYIPPVLEATSLAITDQKINPDSVEIVSSTSHHPALAPSDTFSSTWGEDSGHHSGDDSIGHGYSSSLASADKRRLSFISFADVVQAENEQASHSTTNLDAHSALQPASSLRSQSPVRTPPNPPHSPPGTGLGLSDFSMEKDMSIPPPQAANAAPAHSEVTVETLSQALRRHGSTDLKAAIRSQASTVSAGGPEKQG